MIEQQVTLQWHSVKTDGLPDESGNYLCRFSDGDIESFTFDAESECDYGWHKPFKGRDGKKTWVVFWTDIPEAP